jgi:hypothetical protein
MATPDDLAETVKEVETLDRRIVASQADVRDYGGLKAALDDGVAMIHNQALYHLFLPDQQGEITREQAAPAFQTLSALPIPWLESVDISNAVLFLASDEARFITGVTLPVDAGSLVK